MLYIIIIIIITDSVAVLLEDLSLSGRMHTSDTNPGDNSLTNSDKLTHAPTHARTCLQMCVCVWGEWGACVGVWVSGDLGVDKKSLPGGGQRLNKTFW
jgi:hypothetical protein